jgi:hypothetical protein
MDAAKTADYNLPERLLTYNYCGRRYLFKYFTSLHFFSFLFFLSSNDIQLLNLAHLPIPSFQHSISPLLGGTGGRPLIRFSFAVNSLLIRFSILSVSLCCQMGQKLNEGGIDGD